MVQFTNYGQERERIATESEFVIFHIIADLSGEPLELVRKSDNYVSAVLGDWDVARIKYTPRAKWIQFPVIESAKVKHKLTEPTDAKQFAELVAQSIEHIKKYS